MKHGRAVATGPIAATLSDELLTETFEFPLRVELRDDGRFSARPG